jgi:hypothetical protein
MPRSRTFLAAQHFLLTIAVLGLPARALADDVVKPTPVAAAHSKHLLSTNAAAALLGRFGVDYQLMPAPHHAFVIGGHVKLLPHVSRGTDEILGYGGELGYRFYSGSRGPTGFFIGPSVLAGRYAWEEGGNETNTGSLSRYGVAADVGWSTMIGSHFVLALGGGAQYAWVDSDRERVPDLTRLIIGKGLRPRALVQLGVAF